MTLGGYNCRAVFLLEGRAVGGDIEIEIGPRTRGHNYKVRVVRSAAGGEPIGSLKLNVEEILGYRELLESTLLASSVSRRSASAAERPVREVGRRLFEALFTGAVYGMYRASLGVAQQKGKRLRVVLRLTAPELAALPWETLFDPETETYLCRQEPLVRHVPAPYTPDPLEVRAPLRVLGLVSAPRDLPKLNIDKEKANLSKALTGPVSDGLVELSWVTATWPAVHAKLLDGEWHVLHFIGHGRDDSGNDEGTLAMVGSDGLAEWISASSLADLLGEAQPAPRLVVLNSCSSGRAGETDLFSGAAAALARSGISAVAAMQFAISDEAAIAFARGFYTAIAHGRDADEAARSGRISILGTPRSLEWITPVLYLRGQSTRLFSLAGSDVHGLALDGAPAHDTSRTGRRTISRPAVIAAISVVCAALLTLIFLRPGPGSPTVPQSSPSPSLSPRPSPHPTGLGKSEPPGQPSEILQAPYGHGVFSVAFSPDGTILAGAGYSTYRWLIDAGKYIDRLPDPMSQGVDSVAYGQDGTLATGDNNGSASLWDEQTGLRIATVRDPYPEGVRAVAFSRDSTILASGDGDGSTYLWDASTGTLIATLQDPRSKGVSSKGVNSVAFGHDGTILAAGDGNGRTYLWDITTSKLIATLHDPSNQGVFSVAFGRDDAILAAGDGNGRTYLWDVKTGELIATLHVQDIDGVFGVAFGRDGTILAAGDGNGRTYLWDVKTYKLIATLPDPQSDGVASVAFSPSGNMLAAADNNGSANLWDMGWLHS